MSLIVLNGSPRGKSGNSQIITGWFLKGYSDDAAASDGHNSAETIYLNQVGKHPESMEKLLSADEILLIFPLYVDGMPAVVKKFIEMWPQYHEVLKGKKFSLVVHSGFSESIHSMNVTSYFERVGRTLEMNCQKPIIIPGSEGFRIMPEQMTRKKAERVERLAKAFKEGRPYSEEDLKYLSGPYNLKGFRKILYQLMNITGLGNMFWDGSLKKNGAYERRYDRPYA